jgi:hypothetical protein
MIDQGLECIHDLLISADDLRILLRHLTFLSWNCEAHLGSLEFTKLGKTSQ